MIEGYARGLLQEIAAASISPVAASDGNDSSTPDQTSYNNPFDVNSHFSPTMIIILVILLSAFLFMGFFAVYVRRCTSDEGNFSRHGGNPRAARGGDDPGAALGGGVDPSLVESFPLVSYAVAKRRGCNECVVCLNDFDKDEELRQLPKCKHVFHQECIDSWLASHPTCPLCRRNLVNTSERWSISLRWGGSNRSSVRAVEDASPPTGGSSRGGWWWAVAGRAEGSSRGGRGGGGGSQGRPGSSEVALCGLARTPTRMSGVNASPRSTEPPLCRWNSTGHSLRTQVMSRAASQAPGGAAPPTLASLPPGSPSDPCSLHRSRSSSEVEEQHATSDIVVATSDGGGSCWSPCPLRGGWVPPEPPILPTSPDRVASSVARSAGPVAPRQSRLGS